MIKSPMWTLAMAFAALVNSPFGVDDVAIDDFATEAEASREEGKVDLLEYFPEVEVEVKGLDFKKLLQLTKKVNLNESLTSEILNRIASQNSVPPGVTKT